MIFEALLGTLAATQVPGAAPHSDGAQREQRSVRLEVSFIVNGSSAGDVPVETMLDGTASVDFDQLVARLEGLVTQSVLDDLTARASGQSLVPIATLRSETFPLLFDLNALQLRVDVPLQSRSSNAISIVNDDQISEATATPPSDFSFGLGITMTERFGSLGFLRRFERDPFNVATQGFVNVGGKDGAYLTFLTGVSEGRGPFRSRTTLFHDDTRRAIRYSLGDIDPLSSGSFATPLGLFGLGAERLYQTIQPYRNLRPAGRGALALDRASRVEVYVNGAPYRTLTLAPGRYDLRDFPFLDGVNDVRLVVQDDTGRNESINVSFFSDTELLAPGITIFSATAGFRRVGFGDFQSSRYDGDPTFSGLLQRGVTDRLTLGGSLQADKDNALVTGLAVVGTPIGLFGVEGALDRNNRERLQGAVLLSYRLARPTRTGFQDRFDVNVQFETARFSPMEEARLFRNRYSYEINARYQSLLPGSIYGTVAAGYSRGRRTDPDLKTFGAGLSRSFGRISLSGNYSYRSGSSAADHRATFSLTVPFSTRHIARAGYDTVQNRVALDYNLLGYEGLNQTSAQVSLARDDTGESGNIEVDHFANRFRATLRHTYDHSGGLSVQRTDIALSTGIGYADGQWAFGRDPDQGFVIVRPHRTLRGTEVIVSNRYSLGPAAKTSPLGPALVPLQRTYQPDSLEVDVPDLPTGYDIGPGRLDILPGAGSGYLWTIGSAASRTVLGRIINSNGSPAELLSGILRPVSGQTSKEVFFFTNRNGRIAASSVAPGRYSVFLSGSDASIGEINVPEDGPARINIGELRIPERQ